MHPVGVVDALDRLKGVQDRGFTFVGALGPGQDLVIPFDKLRRLAIERAHHLRKLGLQKGDRLAMVVPDGEDFIPTFLGALWAGIVPVPLYPPLSLGKLDAFMEALVSILRVARPKVLVAGNKVDKILWSVIGKVPTLEKLVTAAELAAPAPEASEDRIALKVDDLAFLQFTSGSTSTPKGVMVTHGSLAANTHAIIHDGLGADGLKGDVGVSWLPLYHDMGLIGFVLSPLVTGVPIVFIPTLSFIRNATLWLETIHKHRGTLSFAPNFAYALAAKRARKEQIARWDLSCMRVFGCGAEPINPDTMRTFVEALAPAGLKPHSLLPCYGMAEATLAMSFVGLSDPLKTDRIDAHAYHADRKAKPAAHTNAAVTHEGTLETVCCGRTFPGHELSIRDENGNALPERTVGEICFKGPSVAAGYFDNPDATRDSGMGPQGDGWLRTGDLGYLAGGEVYISGRIKDILIINGRNYYPQRIEWLVDEIPGVRKGSSVVFSRPGTSSEEVVVAAESREQDVPRLVETIKAKVSEELQLSVADVRIVPPGALPKTSSGKLQRSKTRQQYLDGTLGREGVRTIGSMGSRLLVAKHIAYSMWGRAQHTARGLLRRVLP